ncbi:MAG: dihydropteroate synthase [Planctomycetes bacterium]|nr:dihydropteroate synthase [Planctomycetota bacterium]
MFVIGERINGMFSEVKEAIQERDESVIQDVAKEQLECGANALDINVGTAKGDALENMLWLIESTQAVTDAPLCIDTPKFDVMEKALTACSNPTIINSTKATEEELDRYVPLAVETDSQLVALTISASGVPSDVDSRVSMGATMVTKAMEYGLDIPNLIIDPVIIPVNVAPKQPQAVCEAIRQLKVFSDPPPKFIVGLSNVSQSCKLRSLINRTFLVMAIGAGLDGAIMDATDEELMNAGITAELLLEEQIYCDDYIDAYLEHR